MTASMSRLDGKVVFLTGAASGIGAAIARRCIDESASVICADQSPEGVLALAQSLGPRAFGIQCDVTDNISVGRAVGTGTRHFGRLDGLVHNAAAPSMDGTVIDLAEKQWRLEIDVILTGAFLVGKHALPAMIEGGGGSVVFIASQFAHVATAKAVAYCAAKAGLVHLARAMAVDHAGDGIRVNSLSPGAVATPRLLQRWPDLEAANAGLGPAHLLGRIAKPDEIAAAAAFLLSSDASFVTGTDLLADGGYVTR
ncbi:SDR family oxidoreductase [Rhizobium laguerreae]|uniref:NAD(P)-dependent dehydrogenase (Short-subunit alcohol dehydrogenase family) n=1 Tax=Rhizobium laguerreae TaxID=1076926 RepID=A0ABR6GID3_9HYPH|nr:SDR family oxidoreductase [Rhizobium laguerreae]MBB3166056.1 NAD(P)-dependent dehydrogenase (short-subunit alcohol dehydrogenase family) [Rhizobium laguerreae]MBY3163850.1 SDR family oxidoreductase [Rhizobium laguerreae]MBY3465881.1 SDR family oxidoreductase [Rhizobium laguerreae]OOO52467.1 short-chain dehydrogenase [Rhizobium laguerreae]